MSYILSKKEEIDLIKFIGNFQYLDSNDAKYFFNSKSYYKKRITTLVENKYLKRTHTNLVLDKAGKNYCEMFNHNYNKLNRNVKYKKRLLYISHLAAYYFNCKEIEFTPSFNMKDKQVLTTTARKFIGVLNINGIDHLTYHISKENDIYYIKSVIYDIQKETRYKNIIVLVDDINRIKLTDFVFGYNEVLIIEDTEENREKIKYISKINWYKVINDSYWSYLFLAEYNFCDYTDYKNKYVSTFYFLDTEKINRIKYFLRENENKNVDIICTKELKEKLIKFFPSVHYIPVDIDKYIQRKQNVYD